MMGSGNKNDHPTQGLQNSEGNEKMTLAAHETFYFVGALDELKIVISNSAEVDHTSRKFLLEPEKPLLEFRAIGSKVREACSRENIDFNRNSNQCCCKSGFRT
jgi:vacuolar protein sorting-associated protein 13A/C